MSTVVFGLDSELWSIIASFFIFVATFALTISTTFLARSARKQEKLFETQTKAIVAQTKALVSPRIAIRWVKRVREDRASVLVRNVGIGPADKVIITVSWSGTSVKLPQGVTFLMGPGDERNVTFDLPASVSIIDSIDVECEDVLGNKFPNSIKDRTVTPWPKVTTLS